MLLEEKSLQIIWGTILEKISALGEPNLKLPRIPTNPKTTLTNQYPYYFAAKYEEHVKRAAEASSEVKTENEM